MKLLIALLLTALPVLSAADTFLIENGQPRAEIIIAEKPARMTKLAAKELQTYLEKISGAKLEVRTTPTAGKAHIFLGKSSHTEALKRWIHVANGVLATLHAIDDMPGLMANDTLWKGVAELLAKGFHTLHPSAQIALAVGAALGIVLVLIERSFPKAKAYIPSATGLGLAFTTPGYNSISMFIGASIALWLEKRHPAIAEKGVVAASSGLIAGESLMGVLIAVLVVAGLLNG